jgi:hypothetical protein
VINIYLFNTVCAFSGNKKEVARMYGVESFQNSLPIYTHCGIPEVHKKCYNIQVYEIVKNW